MRDRRHFHRISTRLPVTYRPVPHIEKNRISKPVEAIIRDLSLLGLALETQYFSIDALNLFSTSGVKQISRVHLNLEFPSDVNLEVMGEPVWSRRLRTQVPLILAGLRLRGVSQMDLKVLRDYVRKPVRPPAGRISMMNSATILAWTSGVSYGNPGPAGIGVVLANRGGVVLDEISRYIGKTTNATAEYRALIAAMAEAKELSITKIILHTDSILVRRVIEPDARTKQMKNLQPVIQMARGLMRSFEKVAVIPISADRNRTAERLARKAVLSASGSEGEDWVPDSNGLWIPSLSPLR